jgi:hypothetical protein
MHVAHHEYDATARVSPVTKPPRTTNLKTTPFAFLQRDAVKKHIMRERTRVDIHSFTHVHSLSPVVKNLSCTSRA